MGFDPKDIAATLPRGRVKATKPAPPPTTDHANGDQPPAGELPPDQRPPDLQLDRGEQAAAEQAAADALPPTALIELPIHACQPGYATRRIDCKLTTRQAAAAKVLWSSLAEASARFDGGRTAHPAGKAVENANEGLRYFLDRLADQIEESSGKDLTTDFNLGFR